MLRKLNTILSIALILIFMTHGIMGSLVMARVWETAGKMLAWIGVGILVVHVVIGIVLTVETFKARRTAGGDSYREDNALFWTRRFSGLAMLILIFFHFGLFGEERYGAYIVFEFTTLRLLAQILLVAALFVHLFVNVRPLLVSMGVIRYRKSRFGIFLILSVLLLCMAGATVFYYIQWQFL